MQVFAADCTTRRSGGGNAPKGAAPRKVAPTARPHDRRLLAPDPVPSGGVRLRWWPAGSAVRFGLPEGRTGALPKEGPEQVGRSCGRLSVAVARRSTSCRPRSSRTAARSSPTRSVACRPDRKAVHCPDQKRSQRDPRRPPADQPHDQAGPAAGQPRGRPCQASQAQAGLHAVLHDLAT